MIILGVDPGFSITGYGIMTKRGQKTIILDYGMLKLSPTLTLSKRIGIFHDFFDEKIKRFNITLIALETPFLGKNAQNFLKLGYLRGILYLLADRCQTGLVEFSPREIKKAITGHGGAQKEQIARVLIRLFQGLELPKKLDVTDALAVTLCGAWTRSKALELERL
jgi:crossover junction endodeoxyribonuclease RuvC